MKKSYSTLKDINYPKKENHNINYSINQKMNTSNYPYKENYYYEYEKYPSLPNYKKYSDLLKENLYGSGKDFNKKTKYDIDNYNDNDYDYDIMGDKDNMIYNNIEATKLNKFEKDKNYSFDRKMMHIKNKIYNLNKGKK